ncbi:universal stress protein [Streptomyces sp. SID4919]|uniref:universal stress protein n=1 Tax=unclassified Streptomyces TaxID=2593676 RepID=UPI000823E14E|nr:MULTISPECIES: universal stress protein [unclassified Streptomyces]MYY13986.1 universal stress protein [Streptomyces sp. SID4919]SCK31965.1 Nucleotide-binding universal stress protein, UspA family [Streptomyces sp. AmelKG-E11A]
MPRTVIAGVDGSRESLSAVEWAAGEASRRGLPLRLLHVRDTSPGVRAWFTGAGRSLWPDGGPQAAIEGLLARHPGLEVATDDIPGRPAETLCAAKDQELLVLGSRGLGRLAGSLLGSVSLAVIARSSAPVVLVRAKDTSSAQEWQSSGDVVVGLDTSNRSDAVLEFGFTHAERHSLALRALHSWQVPPVYGGDPTGAMLSAQTDLATVTSEVLAEILAPWREKFPTVAVTERCRLGHPAHDLVEASRDAGLLVVGRRERRAGVGAHIGSVAHAVLHHSKAAVAVVPHA